MSRERDVDLTKGNALPLGSRIRLRRHSQGVRLSGMARDLNYNKAYLSKVENNKAAPSAELLEKIADYLHISVPDLRSAEITRLSADATIGHKDVVPAVGLALPALPAISKEKRALGQRLNRLIAMAHLSQEEEMLIEECLVQVTSDLLALVKRVQLVRSGAKHDEV